MTGHAKARLRDGRVYVGDARLIDGVLTMLAARLRVSDLSGERLYSPTARSWASHEWSEITWLSEPAEGGRS
jgi:hypothetical protein